MADIAEVLWNDSLRHNPSNPHWFNRDRFVLSNGHGSMLHWAATPPATRNATRPRAWKPPPARWARAWAMPWAWRWPKRCWLLNSTNPATPSSTTTPTPSRATAA
ncbi:hypothetical protein G6F50_017300 [Rhizopus delemar]|uniref:Transketolase N-terminal domain-containing protein n=1 Tax=Rhizopus delemar TaxID=936053 RepID=A0A9P6XQF5_9FUNG|nr:hypothetical protein G6F50_017300 [Rhizopus delemar]